MTSTTSAPAPAPGKVDPFAKQTAGASTGMFGKKIEEQLDSSIYSLLEALTTEEIEAFKAPIFEIGKIPEKPPPKEVCV